MIQGPAPGRGCSVTGQVIDTQNLSLHRVSSTQCVNIGQNMISHITTWTTKKASSSQAVQNPRDGGCTPEGVFKGSQTTDRVRKKKFRHEYPRSDKLIGLINERLFVSDYVNNIFGSCSSSTFALRTLRSRETAVCIPKLKFPQP